MAMPEDLMEVMANRAPSLGRSDGPPRNRKRIRRTAILMCAVALCLTQVNAAPAATAEQLNEGAAKALASLYESNEAAKLLGTEAKAALVFPRIIKAGFLFGGQIGEGVLLKGAAPAGYYNSVAASYGLQAGVQGFGYVMFFMDDATLSKFENSSGFEVGVGPSVVIVDAGAAKSMTTTTAKKGIYAFIFDQKGLMAGLGIQGSKISKISK